MTYICSLMATGELNSVCGCKGIRTCLRCESGKSKQHLLQTNELVSRHVITKAKRVFAPVGWSVVSTNSSPARLKNSSVADTFWFHLWSRNKVSRPGWEWCSTVLCVSWSVFVGEFCVRRWRERAGRCNGSKRLEGISVRQAETGIVWISLQWICLFLPWTFNYFVNVGLLQLT